MDGSSERTGAQPAYGSRSETGTRADALDAESVAPADPLTHDDFDQTPAFHPADPEPVAELDLDQTHGA